MQQRNRSRYRDKHTRLPDSHEVADSTNNTTTTREYQQEVRCIKKTTEQRLIILLAKPIYDDVRQTYREGMEVDVSDTAAASRATKMHESLPDVFVKWLRATRILEALEARTMKQFTVGDPGSATSSIDIDPVETGLAKCDENNADTLFQRFLQAIYLHIVLGVDTDDDDAKRVTEKEVVRRIAEVLESITPTSSYFCSRATTAEDVSAPPTEEEKLFKDSGAVNENENENGNENENDTHEEWSGSSDGVGTGTDTDTDTPRGKSDEELDYRDDGGGGGNDSSDGSGDGPYGSGGGSITSGSDNEDGDDRSGVGSGGKLPTELINVARGRTLSRSNYVKTPIPTQLNGEVIRNGWKGAKNAAVSTAKGFKSTVKVVHNGVKQMMDKKE